MNGFDFEPSELYYTVKHLQNNGCAFQYFGDTNYNGRTITVNNKKLLHFASCSYLGLETHPDLINAAIGALKRYGTIMIGRRYVIACSTEREATLPNTTFRSAGFAIL